jgi:hypothetical protein
MSQIDNLNKLQTTINNLPDDNNAKGTSLNIITYNKENLLKMINNEWIKLNTEDTTTLKTEVTKSSQAAANNKRMIDIGRYEQRRYEVRFDLMKYIGAAIVALFIIQLAKRYFLPQSAATGLTIAVVVAISIKIIYSVYDMYIRDSLYYDKYRHFTNDALLEKGGSLGDSEHYAKLLESSRCSTQK